MPVIERHTDYNQVVISVSAFIIVLLLLAVKLLFKDYLRHLFINVFRSDVSAKNFSESNSAGNQASVITGLAAILSTGSAIMTLVVYYSGIKNTVNIKPVLLLLITTGSVIAFVALYKIILWFLGLILDISNITKTYSDMTSDIFRVMGIIIFPLFLILPFSDLGTQNVLIFSVLAIVIVALTVRLYGFFNFLIKIKFFNHYAILYFCVFEILPVLFIIKIIGNLKGV
jgi:hypothetical protein